MSNKQETVADIVAEMRNEGHTGDASCLEWVGAKMIHYADRIESAAKREREAGAEAAQICGEIGEMIGREATREKSSQVGNAAKMREALSDACYAMFNFLKTQNGGYEEMAKALDKAKATLVAQPRNCDVGTDEEQLRRYEELCYSHTCGSRCSLTGCMIAVHSRGGKCLTRKEARNDQD